MFPIKYFRKRISEQIENPSGARGWKVRGNREYPKSVPARGAAQRNGEPAATGGGQ